LHFDELDRLRLATPNLESQPLVFSQLLTEKNNIYDSQKLPATIVAFQHHQIQTSERIQAQTDFQMSQASEEPAQNDIGWGFESNPGEYPMWFGKHMSLTFKEIDLGYRNFMLIKLEAKSANVSLGAFY
jgi:hypothetical protein